MGAHADAIQALIDTHGMPDAAPYIKAYKAEQHANTHALRTPFIFNFGGGAQARIDSAVVDGEKLILEAQFRTGGTVHDFSNPWVIVNAPIYAEDANGEYSSGGRNYTEDLDLVLEQICLRMYEKVSA